MGEVRSSNPRSPTYPPLSENVCGPRPPGRSRRRIDLGRDLGWRSGLRSVEALEPRSRLEPLEDLARLGQQRLGLLTPPLRNEPLARVEFRHRQVERHGQLAEHPGRAFEELTCFLCVISPSRKAGPKPC